MTHKVVWLAGAWLLVIVVARYTTLDQALTAVFHDPETAGFPLRHSAFWSTVMHSGLEYLSIAIWLTLLVSWLLLAWWLRNKRLRGVIGFTLLVAPLSALVVSVLRSLSAHNCPWELAVYGGSADYFRFFDSCPPIPAPGAAYPAGTPRRGSCGSRDMSPRGAPVRSPRAWRWR